MPCKLQIMVVIIILNLFLPNKGLSHDPSWDQLFCSFSSWTSKVPSPSWVFKNMLATANFQETSLLHDDAISFDIVACRPVAGQRSRVKQICNGRCWVAASQTNMFPWKQLNYNNKERWFLRGPCRDLISRTVSWESKVGAMSQLWDICQPVRTSVKNLVRIRYQETSSENIMCTAVQWSL
jgi:hypothetical protein